MADDDESNDDGDNSYLWILFFSLFLVLLVASVYALVRGACSFWGRYCLCRRGCCCVMDTEAYRRERESLRRLRELRHIHRMEQLQLRHRLSTAQMASLRLQRQLNQSGANPAVPHAVELHTIPLATFSQIPGPIPHSFSSTGRVLTPEELQTRAHGLTLPSDHNVNALGFILVPASGGAPFQYTTERRGETANTNDFHFRDNLNPEQRRAILERLLVFTNYHAEEERASTTIAQQESAEVSPSPDDSKEKTKGQEEHEKTQAVSGDLEEGPRQEAPVPETHEDPPNFGFPLHEEPEEIDKTCAICLDDFEEGEQINDASKCPHVFHRDCLLSWLDRHSVCPCCRRTMISANDWQTAANTSTNEMATENSNQEAEQEEASTSA